ncbi:thiol-disulfide oxidoreductase ResA [Bacillus badius]|uniref:Cytochrome c-type biogenesis protein ResA n=1 Tax=Bacillus badius TaxID=1455 RepID=A0ABR5AYM3_BACBA|nr:thiol-disulfide oxidoreductase ResA [Bacillus badius]KIL75178.1 Cytochrome c-type biogenesis protein ResA [Bacillus badius]KIL79836.1 Cytochrome c-type biogenesis protein ResA [Bacillus badius]MED4715083.1 thiol-disulfide oxidoreductase ResA [Bacillus badius]
MNKKKKRLIVRSIILAVLALAVGYTFYSNLTKEERHNLRKGDEAPDFVLTDLAGETRQLSDYKGKGVFLNFWGSWCDPCKKEMPHMEKLAKEYKSQGVEVLAVNVGDSELQTKKFAKQYGLTFPIAIDSTKEVQDAYNITPLPATFMISPDGKIEEIVIGGLVKEEQVRTLFDKVKP